MSTENQELAIRYAQAWGERNLVSPGPGLISATLVGRYNERHARPASIPDGDQSYLQLSCARKGLQAVAAEIHPT